jgi:hypothetical protein
MPALDILALDTATPQVRVPSASDTYRLPRRTEIVGGTVTTNNPALTLTQTWNGAGQAFSLIDGNVTNTASNANTAYFFDFKVGGAQRVWARATGQMGFDIWNGSTGGLQAIYSNAGGLLAAFSQPNGQGFSIGVGIGATSGANVPDVWMMRDAANTLALRNGTAAQAFNVYGTFTDSSNYRRAVLSMTTAGVATLRAEGAGTGGSGNVLHISSLPTSNPGPGILWNNAGTPAIGT